jgi:hypothetical protein
MHFPEIAWIAPSHYAAASGHQVKDQNSQRHNQQDVDQAGGKVKANSGSGNALLFCTTPVRHIIDFSLAVRFPMHDIDG